MPNRWNVFATATATGVAVRYISAMLGMVVAVVGLLGWIPPEQVEELRAMVPDAATAVGALLSVVVTVYAVTTKSSSDKAAVVAKTVDSEVPKSAPVIVTTPDGRTSVTVAGTK